MGAFGLDLVPGGANVLTHCNAGALATVDYGTALGVVRAAHEAGRGIHVYVDETRPFLQGARLTAWELQQLGVPMTLITDNMAGHFMSRGKVDLVIVGADRIAANGDVANKIGTYSLAVLAHEHAIPFYVAAPTSTIDLSLKNGAEIPIEERSSGEVTELCGARIAPEGVNAAHPAFDVTPARLVTAIVTERGVLRPPYGQSLAAALRDARRPIDPRAATGDSSTARSRPSVEEHSPGGSPWGWPSGA
jgi:methylthioribose-1-phosphate isomerase